MKMPIKLTLKTELVPLFFITATVATVLCFYNNLPEKVTSHWNFIGQVDGWSSNTFHGIFFPILIICLYALLLIMPLIDPRKESYKKFLPAYHVFKGLIIATLFIIYFSTTIFNLGYKINVGVMVATSIGIMMMILSFYLKDIKENWFLGIRTPWTMSSPVVWEKTHKFGAWLFLLFGLIIIVMPYLPAMIAIPLFAAGIIGVTLGSFVYSYIVFTQEKNKKVKKIK